MSKTKYSEYVVPLAPPLSSPHPPPFTLPSSLRGGMNVQGGPNLQGGEKIQGDINIGRHPYRRGRTYRGRQTERDSGPEDLLCNGGGPIPQVFGNIVVFFSNGDRQTLELFIIDVLCNI